MHGWSEKFSVTLFAEPAKLNRYKYSPFLSNVIFQNTFCNKDFFRISI